MFYEQFKSTRSVLLLLPTMYARREISFSTVSPLHSVGFWQLTKCSDLAVGAGRDELSLIYEEAENFQALPTFGMIPFFTPDVVHHHRNIFPNFTLGQSLLAEHYLEIRKYPIPTSGNLTTTSKLLGVLDKGNSAIAITGYTTRDSVTDEIVFYNEVTFFMRGCGGFGGQREPSGGMSMGSASRRYALPVDRAPDAVAEYKTSKEQAALYRLTGDTISMHIDPKVSVQGGFPTPILHGACFMGIAGKQIFEIYGAFKSINVKFSGLVIPGDTLKTDIWRERGSQVNWVLFRMTVVETGKICIAGGVVELVNPVKTEGKL
jgi:multifunctional beta-oxidation protein